MNKKLVIVGIIVLLICVGLSGCNEIGLTNIGDLQANPENYVGDEVKVKGTCSYTIIRDDQGHIFAFRYSTNMLSGEYYLIGIVTRSEIGTYYLDVTKAESV